MTDLLRDYELKRSRATLHLDRLRESVERFTKINREAVLGKFDRDACQYVFRVPLEPIDPDWALIVGECVYDMRACLNYLVTALVRSTGQEEDEGSEFPIYGINKKDWCTIDQWWETDPDGQVGRKLNGTPTGTKAAVKELQPFYGVPRTNPNGHPLFALQLLSNRDKHRRLNLLARGVVIRFLDGSGKPLFEGPASAGRISESDEGNAYTVRLAVSEERDVDVYLLPAYDVRLDEPPEVFGDVLNTLTQIGKYIDRRVLPTVQSLIAQASH